MHKMFRLVVILRLAVIGIVFILSAERTGCSVTRLPGQGPVRWSTALWKQQRQTTLHPEIISASFSKICLTWRSRTTRSVSTRCSLGENSFRKTLHDKMRHPILSRVPLVFLGTCFHWAVTFYYPTRGGFLSIVYFLRTCSDSIRFMGFFFH